MTKARAETLATPTMRRALSDPALLGNVLAGESWRPWKVLLIALWGEALDDDERVIFTNLTCRAREPLERCEEFWAIAGRRAGKSRAIAVLIVFLACFVNYSAAIAVGERLIVLCLAQNAKQAAVVFGYVAGIIESVPLLAGLVKSRTSDVLSLTNGLDIEIRAASFRGLRGVTSAAVVADEICIWRDEGSGSTNVDKEILEACRPSLATTRGPLIAIGSPYARRGEAYQTWARHYGPNGDPKILIAQGASRDFNESLPQSVVERAMERDPAWAAAEYLGQWRNDVETFVSRDVIEAAVDRGLVVRPPRPSAKYVGYVDAGQG